MPDLNFNEWAATVRDPASANTEGLRAIECGKARGSYEIAEIPGGWAWTAGFHYPLGGTTTPWTEAPSRDAALAAALGFIKRHARSAGALGTEHEKHNGDFQDLLAALGEDSLLGFIEPEPATEQNHA